MTTLYVPAFSSSNEYAPVESVAPRRESLTPGPCRSSGKSLNGSTGSPSVCMLSTVTSSANSMPLTDAVVVCSPSKSTILASSSPRSSTSISTTSKM